jgi:hypothetical protein
MGDAGMRVGRCLARLAPLLIVDDVALTGSLALTIHAPGQPRPIRDIDLVACSLAAVKETAARELLVSHHHIAQPGVRRTFLQLVDPETRLRIDVFVDAAVVGRASPHPIANRTWRVASAADLLAHKRQLLAAATSARPVDEKHWCDAILLADACAAVPPPRPQHLGRDVYTAEIARVCDPCERSQDPRFRLAPKRAIFDALGYI